MTLEQALEKVVNLPGNFQVKCSHCGGHVAVRQPVFENRVIKTYALGADLETLVTGYVCQACQKKEGLNFLGQKKTRLSKALTLADFGI
jgi:hypothetical protein